MKDLFFIIFLTINFQYITAQCDTIIVDPNNFDHEDTYRIIDKTDFANLFSGKFICGDEHYIPYFTTQYAIIFINITLCVEQCYIFAPNLDFYSEIEDIELLWYFNETIPEIYPYINPEITYTKVGNYYFLYTPSVCADWASYAFHVTYCPPIPNFTASTTTICAGQSITFTDLSEKAPQNWQWEFEGAEDTFSNDTLVDVRYSIPGTYDVQLIVSNPAGEDTLRLEDYITVLPAPAAEVQQRSFDYQIDYGESLQLQVCDMADDYTYSWQPTLGLSCSDCPNPVISPTQSLQYTLTIQQQDVPCQTQCFHNITVIPSGVIVPSAFSPNADDINDVLKPISSLAEVLRFTVYNRWGQKIYEGAGDSAAWDGTFKSQDAPIGSYVWMVEYLPKDENVPRLEQGFAVLIR